MEAIIATNGIRLDLPTDFPSKVAENSGNIIHGNAPRNLFDTTVSTLETSWRKVTSSGSFRDFVNQNCSHLVITMANFFRLGDHSPAMRQRYDYFSRALEGYEKPIVLFGLGSQAKTGVEVSADSLPPEGKNCLKTIMDKATAVSVRGPFTKRVMESVVGDTSGQVFVTGCPSYFSKPSAFERIAQNLHSGLSPSTTAVNVTNYARSADQSLVRQAVEKGYFLVEPENKNIHGYYVDVVRGEGEKSVPSALDFVHSDASEDRRKKELSQFFATKYRLFRHMEPWLDFNREMVDRTIGTRFHVNMASLLAGVPAVWITHDERTVELTETLALPAISIDQVEKKPVEELLGEANFDQFLDAVQENFRRFNEFLDAAGLPGVAAPKLTASA
ncbi:polysaccharide pyruvyl transferase family protein [Corynebacterium genitalium]|nr:polysaccharide pyruvyl transferase family protein [Corynebacterium genitalium]